MTDSKLNPQSQSILDREPRELTPHVTENAGLVDNAKQRAHTNLVHRLFPGQEGRMVQAHELAQLQTGFDFRQRLLQMAVDTKLQAMEEMCNHLLVTGKGEMRCERQAFFAQKTLELQTKLDDNADKFNRQFDDRLQRLETIRHDHLRRREEERLIRTIDQFHAMLAELADEFMAIIHEGVGH